MKVVLKETVYDRIVHKLEHARLQRREADYIVLTPSELDELLRDYRSSGSVQYQPCAYSAFPQSPADLAVSKRSFPSQRRGYGAPYYTTYATYTFRGIDLFAVPEEYHPQ